jgi:hypothetical protein
MFTKVRKNLPLWSGLCVLIILMLFAQSISPAFAATTSNTLTVNANQVLRPVTHVAIGSLYGLANATQPSVSLASAIKPNTFVQKPQGGTQQPDGDILTVAPTASAVGAKLVDRFIDFYPGWPYQFNSSNWLSVVDNQIATIKASSYYNTVSAYAPFNEPDGTWNTANGTFNNIWVTTYREIRAKDSTKPIQGPSFSDNISGSSRAPSMQAFLQNAVSTNTVPDILAWHELSNAAKIAGDVSTVQGIEDSLGISRRPIAIEEYAAPAEVGLPGPLVGYVAKFERLGINNAELAFWNQSGALGDLLTGKGGSPNAAYWMYKWYADMSGNMVVTTPPAQTGIDGFAAVPSGNNQVSIVVGGCSGSCAVTVNGLNSLSLGSTVTVKVDQTVSMGRTVAVSGPGTISTTTYTPSNGTISVPITMVTNNAYLITITPGSGGPAPTPPGPTPTPGAFPVAGTFYRLINRNSGKVAEVAGFSTADGGNVQQWTSTGTSSQQWSFVSVGGGYYTVINRNSGKCLDVSGVSTTNGANVQQWTCTGGNNQHWQPIAVGSYYELKVQHSGQVLDVVGNGTADGVNIDQWPWNSGNNQQWQIIP